MQLADADASSRQPAERLPRVLDRGAESADQRVDMLLAEVPASNRVPFLSGIGSFMTWTTATTLQHRLLGRSFDRIGGRRGLVLTSDTIHLSDRAATALVDLVEPWVHGALSNRSPS